MQLLWSALTVLEVVAADFALVWTLSRRKHSFRACVLTYAGITALILAFVCLVAAKRPDFGDGSGRWMFLGLAYFLPVMVNYGGDWRRRLIIGFYGFTYGLACFGLAVRVGYLFPEEQMVFVTLVAQTALLAMTLLPFLHFSRKKVLMYLRKIDHRQKNLLLRHTLASFALVILYNNTMVSTESQVKKLLVYLLLIYFILLTYRLVMYYFQADADKQGLSVLATTDRLTGLGNRLALRQRAEVMLSKRRPFWLLFMDLDDFKSVNDTLGHTAGDRYLVQFAAALRQLERSGTTFFRLSGDEFVALTRDPALRWQLEALQPEAEEQLVFLGMSVGMAKFPEDGNDLDKLLEVADGRMYNQKRDRRKDRKTV